MPTAGSRIAEVPAGRLPGWVDRFRDGHGGDLRLEAGLDGSPVLHAADGATAVLDLPFAERAGRVAVGAGLDAVLAHVAEVAAGLPYALLLLRRGGWAVGLAAGERVLASRVGTRYVQGRTRKGGSSQQRYARRRGHQAESVVAAAVAAAPEVWGPPPEDAWTLVTGGDRLLLRDALARLGGTAGAEVPVRVAARRLDVPDPRRAVLDAAARSACATRVRVHDAAPPA